MELNIFNGVTIPCKAVEGKITIVETVSVQGDGKKPSVENPITQGDAVALVGDLQVEKATANNGPIIGFAHDHPEYDVDPVQDYTKAQAIAAGVLRNVGVESVFKDVRTVTASGEVSAGEGVEWSANGYKKATNADDIIALTSADTDGKIVIGIK